MCGHAWRLPDRHADLANLPDIVLILDLAWRIFGRLLRQAADSSVDSRQDNQRSSAVPEQLQGLHLQPLGKALDRLEG